MPENLRSILLGTSVPNLALVVAIAITVHRPIRTEDPVALRSLLRVYGFAIAVQCIHFIEELTTGFYVKFPEFLGLEPWTAAFFTTFNLFWIAAWVLAAIALWKGIRVAIFMVWFLAIAAMVNAIAHPALALQAGGYFPGLITSPVLGVVGVLLWLRLLGITRTGRDMERTP